MRREEAGKRFKKESSVLARLLSMLPDLLSSIKTGSIDHPSRRSHCPGEATERMLRHVLCHEDVLDRLADAIGCVDVVHGIEVDTADVVVDQVHDLLNCVKNAGVA